MDSNNEEINRDSIKNHTVIHNYDPVETWIRSSIMSTSFPIKRNDLKLWNLIKYLFWKLKQYYTI